ncbi:MAG: hypothetical protein RR482_02305 [Clostridia bacterium]
MTEQQAAATARAKSLIGDGYIYGATGWVCSLERRKAQAQQYPQYADSILTTGARWDGKACWDCAQVTKTIANAAGITLPSGATSQWNKTSWRKTGTIDTLPKVPAFLYRRANGAMQHTGFSLGDGTFIHAKGTAYGVLEQGIGEYAWTHWATPWKAASEEDDSQMTDESTTPVTTTLYRATVTAVNGKPVNLRKEPGGKIVKRVPVGVTVDVSSDSAGWAKVSVDGVSGWMQIAFLTRINDTLTLRMDALEQRLAALEAKAE